MAMASINTQVKIRRGFTFRFSVAVKDPNGVAVDWANSIPEVSLHWPYNEVVLASNTHPDAVILEANGSLTVKLAPAITQRIDVSQVRIQFARIVGADREDYGAITLAVAGAGE